MNYNQAEDQDLFVDLVGTWQKQNPKYIATKNMSLGKPPIIYQKTKKKKPNGYKKIIVASFLLVTLGFTAGIKSVNAIENIKAYNEAKASFSEVVKDNIHYGEYNAKREEHNWWYDLDQMADDILNNATDQTIDSYIYSSYLSMNPYNKINHMNELFKQMQRKINNNPENYSDAFKNIAAYSSFDAYLEAKGLNIDEYKKIMDKVLTATGKDKQNTEEIVELLNDFNDVEARNGGGIR